MFSSSLILAEIVILSSGALPSPSTSSIQQHTIKTIHGVSACTLEKNVCEIRTHDRTLVVNTIALLTVVTPARTLKQYKYDVCEFQTRDPTLVVI